MNKFFIGLFAVSTFLLGVLYIGKPSTTQVLQTLPQEAIGAASSPDHYNPEYFRNNIYANQFNGLSSVSASSGASSTMPYALVALGAGSNGQFTLGSSTPAVSSTFASTTAMGLNSMVFLQQSASTTIPGVTCNSGVPTSSLITTLYSSSTNLSNNGFKVTIPSIPATNPICYNYWILNKDR